MTQFCYTSQLKGDTCSIPKECKQFNSTWDTEIESGAKLISEEIENLKSAFTSNSNLRWRERISKNWYDRWILWKTKLYFMRVQFMWVYAMVLVMNHMPAPNENWKTVSKNLLSLFKEQVKLYESQVDWVERGYWIVQLGQESLKEFEAWFDEWKSTKDAVVSKSDTNIDKIEQVQIFKHKLEFKQICPVRIESIINYNCEKFGFSIAIDWNEDNTIKAFKVMRSGLVNEVKLTDLLTQELTEMGWKVS